MKAARLQGATGAVEMVAAAPVRVIQSALVAPADVDHEEAVEEAVVVVVEVAVGTPVNATT